VTAILATYGLPGLFVVSFIAALAIPIPAYVVLAGAGALAAQGEMNIAVVLLVALAGNVAADILGYFLARKYGKEILRKIGFKKLLDSSVFLTMEQSIKDFPQTIIYVTRLITEAGPIVNILSGLSGISYRTFIIFDILGEASYVSLFGLSGYCLGDAWKNNTNFIFKGLIALTLFALLLGIVRKISLKLNN
jgi:membrane protein DedA with SNARE-associated domain